MIPSHGMVDIVTAKKKYVNSTYLKGFNRAYERCSTASHLRHSVREVLLPRAPEARASSCLYPALFDPRDFSPCRCFLTSQPDVFNNTQCFTPGNALAASHCSHDFELQALKFEIEGNPVTSGLRVALQDAATVPRHCASWLLWMFPVAEGFVG